MKKIYNRRNWQTRRAAKSLPVFVVVVLLFAWQSANAQQRWRFEVRPGVNVATKDLGDAALKTGFGAEGSFAYRFMPHLSAYAGWSWNRFSADQSFAGKDMDFEETGYSYGLQFIHPLARSSVSYMLKGGATYNHIETENSDGDVVNDTGHGTGWEVGAGVAVSMGKRWLLVPQIRHRSLSRTIKLDEASTPVKLNYVSGGVGFSYAF